MDYGLTFDSQTVDRFVQIHGKLKTFLSVMRHLFRTIFHNDSELSLEEL